MDNRKRLAEQFESYRSHLRKVAFRMLGSPSEADDAVQEAWIRLSRGGARGVENLGGWLTTIVGRVCLDLLRARGVRREEQMGRFVPEQIDEHDAERDILLAESVGRALMIVLEQLAPEERVAYVLHDMFDLPFDQIASILNRSSEAARQLASRARRRVQRGGIVPAANLSRQREIAEAFLAASRRGDYEALIAVLAPDVVLRVDQVAARSEAPLEIRGASKVAKRALAFSGRAQSTRFVLVNGAFGVESFLSGQSEVISTFTVDNKKIVEISIMADPERIRCLDLMWLDDLPP